MTQNVYLLLWVAKHDDAYDWASRHSLKINAETGALQVVPSDLIASEPSLERVSKADSTKPTGAGLLVEVRERSLLRLGVPKELLLEVAAITSEQELELLQPRMPADAFEAVNFLAAGCELDEVLQEYGNTSDEPVDTEDFAKALDRSSSMRRFRVVEGETELKQMLEAPLEKWRVFLHPTQRRLVNNDWNGPVRVLGGAGTGKTVVPMHRARRLAQNLIASGDPRTVLFTTYTANLAADIGQNLVRICNHDERKKIEVINLNAWLHQAAKQAGLGYKVIYPGLDKQWKVAWKSAIDCQSNEVDFPDAFYQDETRKFAVALLSGEAVDDLDENVDSLKGYRSLSHGTPPVLEQY